MYSYVFDFSTWFVIQRGVLFYCSVPGAIEHGSPRRADLRDVTISWCVGAALYFGDLWRHEDDRASEVMTPLKLSMSKHRRSIINTVASQMTKSDVYFYVAGKYFTYDSHLKIIDRGSLKCWISLELKKDWIKFITFAWSLAQASTPLYKWQLGWRIQSLYSSSLDCSLVQSVYPSENG
jgi:hypothetical protein